MQGFCKNDIIFHLISNTSFYLKVTMNERADIHVLDAKDNLISLIDTANDQELCQMFGKLSIEQKKQAMTGIIQQIQCNQRNTLWSV